MKMIIAYMFLAFSAFADPLYFTWRYNDPIDHFRIYTGAVPHVGENVFVIPSDARRAQVEVPDNHYAWITANDHTLESTPSAALQYKPVTVNLVIQQSKDLREWGGQVAIFSFRLPDAIAGTVGQRLNITRTEIQVTVLGTTYRAPIPTGAGKKFFRSYVAVVP